MNRINVETGVGILLIAGIICLGYLSVMLGDVALFGTDGYRLSARFTSVTGLKKGAGVEIAGVSVGKVSDIRLDEDEAMVKIIINRDVKIQEDSIAAVRTQGIIGDKYIKMIPGGADEMLGEGDEIIETESAIEIEELISKYIFEGE